jgi:anaerobic selenocysteine-containing dehydrogenase
MSNKFKLLESSLNLNRRDFLKTSAVGAAAGLVSLKSQDSQAFAYEPYPS